MATILFASGNRHKLREVRGILEPLGIRVLGADDVGGLPPVDETGATFAENAVLKARSAAETFGMPALADDSGLEVTALGGRPGIYSSRYAGPDSDDRRNMMRLLREMDGVEDRRARFVCILAVVFPDGRVRTFEGEVRGRIAHAPRGEEGFGYDPIFVPEGFRKTFGELGEAVKQKLSHRARALRNAVESGIFAEIAHAPDDENHRAGDSAQCREEQPR